LVIAFIVLISSSIPTFGIVVNKVVGSTLHLPAGGGNHADFYTTSKSSSVNVSLVAVYPTNNKKDNYTRVKFTGVTQSQGNANVSLYSGNKVLYEGTGNVNLIYSRTSKANCYTRFYFTGNKPDLAAYAVIALSGPFKFV
jgi:hypothetical protein